MPDTSHRSLLAKTWTSLVHKGPIGLGRDVRDYLRWRMRGGAGEIVEAPWEKLSNWDLNQEELRALPEVLRSKPILVYAEASTRCNLHCFMCRLSFPETTRRTRQHMALDTFSRLGPLLEPGSRLSLFGLGEPLLNPDFLEMLRIAKERGAFVGLNSNAMLLTERVARSMVELEQDLLMISFSGGTRETYERVITGASYDRVIANLRCLNRIKGERVESRGRGDGETEELPLPMGERERARGHVHGGEGPHPSPLPKGEGTAAAGIERVRPVLELQYTAMRDNLDEIPEAVRLAIDLRCAGMVVMPLTVVDPSLEQQSILVPELRPRVEGVFEAAREVAAAAPYPFELRLPAISVQCSVLSAQRPAPDTSKPALICYEPWQTFYARDDGTVNTCCYSNRVLGDLKRQTALEIWNGELYRRFRARMRSDDKPAECRVCHKLCGGDWYDQRVDDDGFYDEL